MEENKVIDNKSGGRNNDRRDQRGGERRRREPEDNGGIDTHILQSRRISRMYHGGRRMRFGVFVVAGDRNGRVGIATGKGTDVSTAQKKATDRARRSIKPISIAGNTIPHEVEFKFKASRVMLKPAAPGTGIIAGATVKAVAELAGIKDLLTKVHGSTNPINTAYATVEALKSLRKSKLNN